MDLVSNSVSLANSVSLQQIQRKQREMLTGELDPIDTDENIEVNSELSRTTGKVWNPLVDDKGHVMDSV